MHENAPFQSIDEILERKRAGGMFRYLLGKLASFSGIRGMQPKILVRDEIAFAEMDPSRAFSTTSRWGAGCGAPVPSRPYDV